MKGVKMYQKIIDDFSNTMNEYRNKKKEFENKLYESDDVMCRAETDSKISYKEYRSAKESEGKYVSMITSIDNILMGLDIAREILLDDHDFMDGLIKENGGYKPCLQK